MQNQQKNSQESSEKFAVDDTISDIHYAIDDTINDWIDESELWQDGMIY